MKEEKFRNRLIRDLDSRGVNVVNLKGGTFDIIIEGNRPIIGEIKRITKGGHRGFEEDEKGFSFTEEQSKEIPKMKFPPFVVAFYENEIYFLDPNWVKREVTDLMEYKTAIMYFSVRPFPTPITYSELIEKIIKFI